MITYLLLLMGTACHLTFDLHKIYSGHPIRHWASAAIVLITAFSFGIINQWFTGGYWWWQFMTYSLAIHFALFDPLWNLLNKHKWYYSGDPNNPQRALTDRFWDYMPVYAQPLVRLCVFSVGYGFYYHWNWIIGTSLNY